MPITPLDQLHRREFLRRVGALGLGAAATPLAMNLAALGEAAAATSTGDYKALVCVYLAGGNDYANMVVPVDTSGYQAYAAARPALALPQAQLLALPPNAQLTGSDAGRQMGFAPQMTKLQALFKAGRLGVQMNVGTLLAPTTLAQYQKKSVPLPPQLFSHNDQQSLWQSLGAEGTTVGWGGRLGDRFLSGNGNAVFTCINVSGNAVFLSGQQALQYMVSPNGALAIGGLSKVFGSADCGAALRTLLTATDRSHWMEQQLTDVATRQISSQATLSSALAALPALNTAFDANNSLALQLKMVARLIAARSALGVSRQVFFVQLGGFDLHSGFLANHPRLLTLLSDALASFHDATVELGVSEQVTSFTASEFGRSLVCNGDGSDHGWGAHHLVMGGAVQGGRYWGHLPTGVPKGADDAGRGSFIPTSSVEQMAATMGRWLGVGDSDLNDMLPHLSNFTQRDLGYFG
ncbi:DUF1501 domain-containing protein [Pelomonas sp. KK5]|uniref:DUF1501 domain-containing protein n=1 Tax=Pelomonas sp. KK5 TaxID=1855730 RepID=UPI00097C0D7E|nr:DUF1501 domain-containing protein [Pelomonas sp. KK5]